MPIKTQRFVGLLLISILLAWMFALNWLGSLDLTDGKIDYHKPINLPSFPGERTVPSKNTIPGESAIPSKNKRQGEENKQAVILFFAFTQCPSICPTTLNALSSLYNKHINKRFPSVKVLIIDLQGNKKISDYVKGFNHDFIGVTMDKTLLNPLMLSLNATAAESPEGEINHTSSIYLLNKVNGQWFLKVRYIEVPKPELIIGDLIKF